MSGDPSEHRQQVYCTAQLSATHHINPVSCRGADVAGRHVGKRLRHASLWRVQRPSTAHRSRLVSGLKLESVLRRHAIRLPLPRLKFPRITEAVSQGRGPPCLQESRGPAFLEGDRDQHRTSHCAERNHDDADRLRNVTCMEGNVMDSNSPAVRRSENNYHSAQIQLLLSEMEVLRPSGPRTRQTSTNKGRGEREGVISPAMSDAEASARHRGCRAAQPRRTSPWR
eukprot:491251-Rhodomonas_salina.2